MKNINKILVLFFALAFLFPAALHAEKKKGETRTSTAKAGATCIAASNSNELTINNVSAYIETNGTMWFKELARYEIPKGSSKTSMFAAALWIGGQDVNGQLKLAAVRFRQVGDDFWTGPLSTQDASILQATCSEYDRFFKITREQVERHIEAIASGATDYVMPNIIAKWPAHGNVSLGQSKYLAPFFDADGNGEYNPEAGDYPYYDLDNSLCPWTPQNLAAAAAGTLPKTPEEEFGISKGMVYADHVLKGDETLFWIFNDKGGPHTESKGEPIGLEIRGQAFAFATNDELNNMTFYSYEIINRSTYTLTNTYFSQWVDPDLGYAADDLVGCDVARGLGYCYNGRDIDGQGLPHHYGANPPAVGVDFFQGPYIDKDGRDNPRFYNDSANVDYCARFLNSGFEYDQMAINGVNFGDGIVDNERFGMRRFVYHNNDQSVIGDPQYAYEYYNMLRGIWGDNTRMRFGGNAHKDNPNATSVECDFMFPGTTDRCNWGTGGVNPAYEFAEGWTEENARGGSPNPPGDRRFMQSAGPFTLEPGAVNYITVGIPWARASQGGAWASVELLKLADDKCQALFENCFKVLDGPDAPDVTYAEYENEIILFLSNDNPVRNNFNETYEEQDPSVPEYIEEIEYIMDSLITKVGGRDTLIVTNTGDTISAVVGAKDTIIYQEVENIIRIPTDNVYRFEGYIIYQLRNKDVSVTDLSNQDKARVVAQCDIENYRPNGTPIGTLINYIYDESIGKTVPTEMVVGANRGVAHSFSITNDAFASGSNKRLVNHKAYYYMVIAYAYNEYAIYDERNEIGTIQGQRLPFLAGRKNIKVVTVIPHKPAPQNNGTILRAEYGTQPQITRIEGQGNGGYFLDLTDESHNAILANNTMGEITYKQNAGPIGVKVIDPLRLKPYDYTIKFSQEPEDVTDSSMWELEILDLSQEDLAALDIRDSDGNLTNIISSNNTISIVDEQLILPLGISIMINNYQFKLHERDIQNYVTTEGGLTYPNLSTYGQVDLISSSIEYADELRPWLSGIADIDGNYPANWIRSGTQNAGNWTDLVRGKYDMMKTEDFFSIFSIADGSGTTKDARAFLDPRSQFENVVSRTWGPYPLTSPFNGGPQAKYYYPDKSLSIEPASPGYEMVSSLGANVNLPGHNRTLTNLYSVDVVLTPDKSKWTRCVVLEACDDHTKSIGNAYKNEPRKSRSVDINGRPIVSDRSDSTGMGWFPGYAINVETGERLNIMFSENSSDSLNNGHDMLFNPTSVYAHLSFGNDDELVVVDQTFYNEYFDIYAAMNGENLPPPSWGGRHMIYVCGSSGSTSSWFYRYADTKRNYNDNDRFLLNHGTTFSFEGKTYPYYECGPYDEGEWLRAKFSTFVGGAFDDATPGGRDVRKRKMQLFNNVMWTSIAMPARGQESNWLSNEVRIKIRVSRPYLRYTSRWYNNSADAPYASQNGGFPMYKFSTKEIAPITNATETHDDILKEINIVPNPYYGFAHYENTAVENTVKIVNLPEVCTISIYTVNGTLVKKITKGDKGSTYVDWDLKNHANIPIGGGMYIIYVNAEGIGERTLKFFCAMRPTDLNAF